MKTRSTKSIFQKYRDQLKASSQTKDDPEFKAGLVYQSGGGGTTGNFEGPQVHIKGIKFHQEFLTSKDIGSRLKHLDGISAHFDPDHPYYGLPDVKISIKDVRLYNPHKNAVAQFLNFKNDDPAPYKVYKKRITDSLGNSKNFEMQLWLTEFDVTIDVRPDKDVPIAIGREEQEATTYPGYWYGSGQSRLNLKALDGEHKDFRYGDLSFILEIIPDNSPIYVNYDNGITSKADFAIGAIYCQKAVFGNEPDVQRISANVHAGQPLFLNNSFDFEKMNRKVSGVSENMEENATRFLELKAENSSNIWNKPYYVKLFFNNLGTWRSGLFNQNQFHDQVSYSFLMPVFVVGSWDVIAPQQALSEWDPPKPFVREFSIKNLLPAWHLGWGGKFAGLLLIGIIAVIALLMIFPGLLPVLILKLKRRK